MQTVYVLFEHEVRGKDNYANIFSVYRDRYYALQRLEEIINGSLANEEHYTEAHYEQLSGETGIIASYVRSGKNICDGASYLVLQERDMI